MTQSKLSVMQFGDILIRTQDLDPAYVGLVGAALPMEQMYRWLLAYWCFYHVGVACWLSEHEGSKFWDVMLTAAFNEKPTQDFGLPAYRWPRAAERRHFRGDKCVTAVKSLRAMSQTNGRDCPEFLVRGLTSCRTEKAVMTVVQSWPMFGPWIAFKAADMLERCVGVPVKFNASLGLMYEEPRAALDILVELGPQVLSDKDQVSTGFIPGDWNRDQWYNALMLYFQSKLAPPAMDRVCGPQELETVLCKWKSYMGDHYWPGKDIREHRGALEGWGSTAASMLAAMPQEVEQ